MNERQKQKIETRNKIVENAFLLYAKDGFQVPTSNIAKASNVSHGTIFSHFSTKDDLLIFVIGEFGEKLTNRLHEISISSMSLKTALSTHVDIIEEYEDFYIQFIREKHNLPDMAKMEFISIQSAASHHLEAIFQKDSTIDISLPMIFNTWVGLLHYYLLNKDFFSPNSSVLKKYKNELVDTFMKMIYK
ncbi:AcrR family transcriptional regulator [Breznakia sp. PF5-3]|uniref:TetR/AcrR family transcriptional regulator n=1 Tax=unclassified Breznakia TaxID=2623764 RepID=UPI002405C3BE|nr:MULTISPECIES: TetR/AcrR family transcriptional regulator [unclassified Breznakia]MDF9823660.1 AcrR family transcriptional regulator [Breznakia sp. PM6-1]MDF9834458.1 AcrR family transcriptional regulator [Breznakia sp. PF5-3]